MSAAALPDSVLRPIEQQTAEIRLLLTNAQALSIAYHARNFESELASLRLAYLGPEQLHDFAAQLTNLGELIARTLAALDRLPAPQGGATASSPSAPALPSPADPSWPVTPFI